MVPRAPSPPIEVVPLEEELSPILAEVAFPEEASASALEGKKAKRAQRAKARVIHVDARTVLRLAERGRAPTGQPVPKAGARPAGIRLSGVAALGIGLAEGDVLVEVEGRSMAAPGEVIAAVIGARTRRQATMSGKLYRGREMILLTVEMPYVTSDPPREPAL